MAQSGLIVRRSVRHEIVLPARVRVAAEHSEAIRYAKGVADSDGWMNIDLVDFATGGVGFISTVFFPRGAAIQLRIPAQDDPAAQPLVDIACRVMRVQMTDRRPAYLVGAAYTVTDDASLAQVDALIARIEGENH